MKTFFVFAYALIDFRASIAAGRSAGSSEPWFTMTRGHPNVTA